MLTVRDLDVFYSKTQALWGVSITVYENEIVALVGANASGKSTILNTICGLLRPASGFIEFLGNRLNQMPPHRIVEAGISHIPEGRKLFTDMTVLENLELGSYLSTNWRAKEQTLDQVFHVFPVLEERSKQLARTLSGGQQQMLAIARGLMSRPKLCMLDEPSHGLSPILVREIFQVIKSLREHHTTVLLVEQNVQRSLEISDRGYVLENGVIVLHGTGQQLMQDDHIKEAYLGL